MGDRDVNAEEDSSHGFWAKANVRGTSRKRRRQAQKKKVRQKAVKKKLSIEREKHRRATRSEAERRRSDQERSKDLHRWIARFRNLTADEIVILAEESQEQGLTALEIETVLARKDAEQEEAFTEDLSAILASVKNAHRALGEAEKASDPREIRALCQEAHETLNVVARQIEKKKWDGDAVDQFLRGELGFDIPRLEKRLGALRRRLDQAKRQKETLQEVEQAVREALAHPLDISAFVHARTAVERLTNRNLACVAGLVEQLRAAEAKKRQLESCLSVVGQFVNRGGELIAESEKGRREERKVIESALEQLRDTANDVLAQSQTDLVRTCEEYLSKTHSCPSEQDSLSLALEKRGEARWAYFARQAERALESGGLKAMRKSLRRIEAERVDRGKVCPLEVHQLRERLKGTMGKR